MCLHSPPHTTYYILFHVSSLFLNFVLFSVVSFSVVTFCSPFCAPPPPRLLAYFSCFRNKKRTKYDNSLAILIANQIIIIGIEWFTGLSKKLLLLLPSSCYLNYLHLRFPALSINRKQIYDPGRYRTKNERKKQKKKQKWRKNINAKDRKRKTISKDRIFEEVTHAPASAIIFHMNFHIEHSSPKSVNDENINFPSLRFRLTMNIWIL